MLLPGRLQLLVRDRRDKARRGGRPPVGDTAPVQGQRPGHRDDQRPLLHQSGLRRLHYHHQRLNAGRPLRQGEVRSGPRRRSAEKALWKGPKQVRCFISSLSSAPGLSGGGGRSPSRRPCPLCSRASPASRWTGSPRGIRNPLSRGSSRTGPASDGRPAGS